jgi:hypothetical protein
MWRAWNRPAVSLLGLIALGSFGCHDHSSPTGPVPSLAGPYSLTTVRQCLGGAEPTYIAPQTIVLTQTGDQISFLLGVDTGGVQGTVHGNTIDLVWQDGLMICSSQLKGIGMIGAGSIDGSVSGQPASAGCDCDGSTLTIAFNLVRK